MDQLCLCAKNNCDSGIKTQQKRLWFSNAFFEKKKEEKKSQTKTWTLSYEGILTTKTEFILIW